MYKKLFFLLIILGISIVQAQEKTITGIVYETFGPLPGVSVLVKGTTNGVQTDFDGKYSIKASIGDTLVYTYLGFKTAYKTVGKSSIINVTLLEDAQTLDEIVIVGYGTSTKNYTTSSAVSSVKASQKNKRNYNISQSLSGKVSGVQITNQPYISSAIRIRGNSSISNNNEPLYVVDGVPINNNYNSIIKDLDKNSIEKINVLKDDKATSLYGNRASNGCIIITTKKGNYSLENDESYAQINENKFKRVQLSPLSTFSIDVDKASYSNVRRMINNGEKVPFNAVKIEEMINYFDYQYPQPKGEHPFSINTEFVETPWNTTTKLVKIGLQGKTFEQEDLPASNLTFLIDVSGSMGAQNKLPLLKSAFKLLVNQLRKEDKVAIVVYAGAAGVVLKPTSGNQKEKILNALNNLESGGSTAGGKGIKLAYKLAEKNFKKNGNNRVILATDGDFNVGASSDERMEKLIAKKRETGVFLSVLGFGYGNYKDSKLEILADKGNGNHAYIDTMQEAQKVFGQEFGGTLHTIAKDVKIQVEFNPNKVKGYRLIGYENRLLNDEDFIDDSIDAGELGAGHKVTALYEIILAGTENEFLKVVPDLKYTGNNSKLSTNNNELFTVKFRYKKPSEDKSFEMIHIQNDEITNASEDMKFATAVALFGLKLRKSQYINKIENSTIIELAKNGKGEDVNGYRAEFIRLVKSI
ncbi:VWA domain-containing protein [Polaribacter sp. Hel_I_88]|uniref:VWA domain-containing protein n=1 Tax=Polaribacter sp. Hel_I_88 TaxID=1250006 RepID=UPI00047B9465|nr:VWA domain-containing protein [Polaribacter sp. Hel_I_88]